MLLWHFEYNIFNWKSVKIVFYLFLQKIFFCLLIFTFFVKTFRYTFYVKNFSSVRPTESQIIAKTQKNADVTLFFSNFFKARKELRPKIITQYLRASRGTNNEYWAREMLCAVFSKLIRLLVIIFAFQSLLCYMLLH